MTPLKQTTFEIIVANGEIAHNEQFFHLSKCFQLYSMVILSLTDIFHILNKRFSMSSAAAFLYVGKG